MGAESSTEGDAPRVHAIFDRTLQHGGWIWDAQDDAPPLVRDVRGAWLAFLHPLDPGDAGAAHGSRRFDVWSETLVSIGVAFHDAARGQWLFVDASGKPIALTHATQGEARRLECPADWLEAVAKAATELAARPDRQAPPRPSDVALRTEPPAPPAPPRPPDVAWSTVSWMDWVTRVGVPMGWAADARATRIELELLAATPLAELRRTREKIRGGTVDLVTELQERTQQVINTIDPTDSSSLLRIAHITERERRRAVMREVTAAMQELADSWVMTAMAARRMSPPKELRERRIAFGARCHALLHRLRSIEGEPSSGRQHRVADVRVWEGMLTPVVLLAYRMLLTEPGFAELPEGVVEATEELPLSAEERTELHARITRILSARAHHQESSEPWPAPVARGDDRAVVARPRGSHDGAKRAAWLLVALLCVVSVVLLTAALDAAAYLRG